MTNASSVFRPLRRLAPLAAALLAALPAALHAQSSGTGIISGRVFNPATKEYVQNAQVAVQGTNLSAVSADDGSYALLNVPAGTATVTVDYTGYKTATKQVAVMAGQTVTSDFSLISAEYKPAAGAAANEPIKLEAFTVETQREGNAKAIMQQKQAMTISRIVASETFGDVPEGNVGEFLKYLPAITMDYVEADARNPRIRGLPAQYTTVAFNGLAIASADAFIQNNGTDNGGGAGKGDRSFGFDVVSMSSVGTVEVDYTVNASQDANGAAGSINLISKHAYERSDAALNFTLKGMMNSEEMRLSKIVRPDFKPERMILPNANIEYTNSFFGNRLGIVAAFDEVNTFNEQRQYVPTYDTTPTATDPRPLVITKIQYKDGPKFTERSTASFSLDFKATDTLSASFISLFNNYNAFVGNRTFAITSPGRASIGGDGLTAWNNVPVSSVTQTMQGLNKRTYGFTHMPILEWKWDKWDVTAAGAWSKSTNNYNGGQSKAWPGNTSASGTISTTGMTASASRPADNQYAWTVQQTGGLDWGNLNNYKASATGFPTFAVDGRYVTNIIYEGRLDGKYTTGWTVPTWFQVGGKTWENTFDYRNPTSAQIWNYIGPGGGNGGSWGQFQQNGSSFQPGNGARITSITGHDFAVPNQYVIGQLFQNHPEYFVPAATPAQYLIAYVNNSRYIREQIDAGYAMFDTKPLPRFEIQGGVRLERVRDETKNYVPLPAAQVVAAGFPVTNGVATTIPGINYQYINRGRFLNSTSKSDLYPSASAKYSINKNLVALFGYSYTVTRPSFNDIAGVATADDANLKITIPNPTLKPEYSNNYTLSLTQYFEPVGEFGVSVFENDFKNYVQSVPVSGATVGDALAAQGFTGPLYAGYQVTTPENLPGTVTYRGASLDYSQSLSFLPHPFEGFSVFANYTRLYYQTNLPNPSVSLHASAPYNFGWLPGITPNTVNYGVSWEHWRLKLNVKARWADKTGTTSTYNTYLKQNTKVDLDASFRMTDHLSLIFTARNIFDVPDYVFANNNPQQIGGGRSIEYYGAYLYGGIKGSF